MSRGGSKKAPDDRAYVSAFKARCFQSMLKSVDEPDVVGAAAVIGMRMINPSYKIMNRPHIQVPLIRCSERSSEISLGSKSCLRWMLLVA